MSFLTVKEDTMNSEQRLYRSRTMMYYESPFFAVVLMNMKFIKCEDKQVTQGTAGIDAKGRCYYDEDFIMGLSQAERFGLVAHECMHPILNHLTRTGGRDQQLWNIATDLAINTMLVNSGFTLPEIAIIPHNNAYTFKEVGITIEELDKKGAEEIYEELLQKAEEIKKGMQLVDGGESNPSLDNHIYGFGNEKGDSIQSDNSIKVGIEQKWRNVIAEAANVARRQGKLPAGLGRLVEEVLEPKIDWRTQLYRYIVNQIMFDYTYQRPHKRSAAIGFYLPGTVKESLNIFVSIDTSGSISKEDMEGFLGELLGIGDAFQNINIRLIICDAKVHEVYDLTKANVEKILSLEMSGGGGTDHRPIYDYIVNNTNNCSVLINFTDGFTHFPSDPSVYNFDSLWVISKGGAKNDHIPFGRVIRLAEE